MVQITKEGMNVDDVVKMKAKGVVSKSVVVYKGVVVMSTNE